MKFHTLPYKSWLSLAQHSFIERFNRTYRQEILGAYLFEELNRVRVLSEERIKLNNLQRPHDSLRA